MTTQRFAMWPPSVRGPWRTPALVCLDIGDIGDPDLIGDRCLEPLLQPVLGHGSGFAAISAGTAPVAHLCGDPGQGRQARHPVLGNPFTLVTQIVGELAIAINLATVDPGLPDQLGLARIFQRTVA